MLLYDMINLMCCSAYDGSDSTGKEIGGSGECGSYVGEYYLNVLIMAC